MATFVAKNSGGVKKKPVIILKYFFFSFWFQQAAPATSRHGSEIEDKIDRYVSYRVFFLCEATKDAGDLRNYNVTRKSNYT